jgi:hypothetical protein
MLRRFCTLAVALVAALSLSAAALADTSLSAEIQLPVPLDLPNQATAEGPVHFGTSFSSISGLCYHVLYTGGDLFAPGDSFALDPGGWGRVNFGPDTRNDELACTNASSIHPNALAQWLTGDVDTFLTQLGGSGRIAAVVATVAGVPGSPVGFTASGTGPASTPTQGSTFTVGSDLVPAGDVALPLAVSVHALVTAPGATVSVANDQGSPPFSTSATVHLAPTTPPGPWYVVLTATGGGFTRTVEIPFDVADGAPADTTAPVVTGTPTTAANADGWYAGDVTVDWSATDPAPSSGAATTPADSVVSGEGAGLVVTSSPSCDPAGNCAVGTQTVSIDRTAPIAGTPSFGTNPLRTGGSTSVTATAADALSGVAGGEAFVGADPGAGDGTPLALSGGTLSATLTAPAAPGVYTVGVRSRDRAGNWSATSTAYLVAYDPSAGFVTGGGWLVPGGPTSDPGDALPGLDGKSKANFGFEAKYDSNENPKGNLELTYGSFHLHATGTSWLVVTGTSAVFQGGAAVDGQAGVYAYRVDATDGSGDRIRVRVWAPGASPDSDAPIWQASGAVQGQVLIHQ